MPSIIYHIWRLWFPHYLRNFLVGMVYLSLSLGALLFLQLSMNGFLPKSIFSMCHIFVLLSIFYSPVSIALSTLIATLWTALKWKEESIPLFFELNGVSKRWVLMTVLPFLTFVSLLMLCSLHLAAPKAGQTLKEMTEQSVGQQIPVASIQKINGYFMGSELYSDSHYESLIFATDTLAFYSDGGTVSQDGILELEKGYLLDIQSTPSEWRLNFSKGRMHRKGRGLPWSVHMLTSEELTAHIKNNSEPAPLKRELYKRTTQPLAFCFLVFGSVVWVFRRGSPGSVLLSSLLIWWLVMRFFDHQVNVFGALGAAIGPVITHCILFVLTVLSWRVR
jgi:hypothetical protein